MLTLILGRAGSGKTASVMRDIREGVLSRMGGPSPHGGGLLLLVPEQYSHEAERELCLVCGDALSLYGEVLSFTRLCSRVFAETGGASVKTLDKGGRVLVMARAVAAVAGSLTIYGGSAGNAELLSGILMICDELKSACIGPSALTEAAELADGALGEKLTDLSLILEAYEAFCAQIAIDPSDRLTRLKESIKKLPPRRWEHIYIDGFTDFTSQELEIIEALMKSGAEITVCLTCDDMYDGDEIFKSSRLAAEALRRMAEKNSVPVRVKSFEAKESENPALGFFERNMFTGSAERFDGDAVDAFKLRSAHSVTAECELAAARVLELVRKGARYRDIAIAVRGFEDYRPALESVFARYEVPLFLSRKSELMQKPLPALIFSAFDIILGGWDYDSVFRYLKTGLAGPCADDRDILENYVLMWSIRGSAWTKQDDWGGHPEGFSAEFTDKDLEKLRKINRMRRETAQPLQRLYEAGKKAETALGQAEALYAFLEHIGLSRRLDEKAAGYREAGREALAAEYRQMWDILIASLEQCAGILTGDTPMTQDEFSRLLRLVLSQYDIGVIPVSLDRVAAGDMDRMRRRHVKHLIVLGASDDALPAPGTSEGLLSTTEREKLYELGLSLITPEDSAFREMSVVYNCLTLPSESLAMSYSLYDEDGNSRRPSFLLKRLTELFALEIEPANLDEARLYAPSPCFEFAAGALREPENEASALALAYFNSREAFSERLAAIREASAATRGKLSGESVYTLYGDAPRLSASRVEKLASCRFGYFLQFGLKAKARVKAAFDAPEMGTFMHYVLENVTRRVMEAGGFSACGEDECLSLADEYVDMYIREVLHGFREKSARFIYLFRRLINDVRRVVSELYGELSGSDFVPLDFELDFSGEGDLPPVELNSGEGVNLTLSGKIDRVDGWLKDGKLYLRAVDYKTGKKEFSLSDVWYGMGMQMLIYLFALERSGEKRYGHEIVPAGVLYAPARDLLVSAPGSLSDEEIAKKRARNVRRSGLILDDGEVLEAMEHGDAPRYLPVKYSKAGVAAGDSLASAEKLGILSRHVDRTLLELGKTLTGGGVDADPYYRSAQDSACTWCDYFDACHFDETRDSRRPLVKLPPSVIWNQMEHGG